MEKVGVTMPHANHLFRKTPASHPYIAVLKIDPVNHLNVARVLDEDDAYCIVDVDKSEADEWVVFVGCAST
ncbi:hypothetical protein, partial [Stappia sediminis]|uniref:hypothetical protein n=1 Tax=Stappia sediminis TaxID=2692190 RepID=UPI001AD8FF29